MRKFLNNHFTPMLKMGLLVVFLFSSQDLFSQNLVVNGDFESGNLIGFSSNYTFIPGPTGSTNAGQYAIGQNPQPFNTASFFSMGDHTSGNGNMMIVDGTNNGGNTEPAFWRINNNGEICGLTIGETYTFSYYVKSIYRQDIAGASSADIGIKWNNVQGQSSLGIIIPTSGNMLVLPPIADWQRVTYTIIPTNSCVRIEMFNRNSNLAGNDFAIDDIELLPPVQPLQLGYAIIPPVCPDANDGFIAAYGRGGKAPYAYRFNSSAFSSNIVLANLGAVSGQSITVRDANTPSTELSVTDLSMPAPVNPLDAGPNGTVCPGQIYQLTATGGSSYTWTATPEDTSLTTPNIANPLVKPRVNTVYNVSSQVSLVRNLVFNGNFSEGSSGSNVGFGSDYIHRPSNPNGLQGVYGIVSNAQAFYKDFSTCSGTGGIGDPMLVADGSTKNDAKVWWQQVPVQPNTLYTFTYYLQSVQAASPALIETRINNQPITGIAGTSTQTALSTNCTWQQVTYTWNSGSNTLALIALFNRNLTAGGNDFAIDDISFTTNTVCTFSRKVTVNVSPIPPKPVISAIKHPTCDDPGGAFDILSPVGPNYLYSNDSLVDYGPGNKFGALPSGNWKLFAKEQNSGCVSEPLLYTINSLPAPPEFPEVERTQFPICADPSGGIVTVKKPLGTNLEYSIDGINYQSNPVFANLTSGSFYMTVRDKIFKCVSERTGVDLLHIPPAPDAPTASVTRQPTCANPTGIIEVTAPNHINMSYSLDGINWQTDKTFTGVSPNTYNLRARIWITGCISSFTPIVVNAPAGAPSAPVAIIKEQTGCNISTGTIEVTSPTGSGLEYSMDGTRFQTSTIFSGLNPGTYQLIVRNQGSTCFSIGNNLIINAIPVIPSIPLASVTAQPTCTLQSGTITVAAPLGPDFQYTVNGTEFMSDPVFDNLSPGTYQVAVKNIFTGCVSAPLSLTVNNAPAMPPAPNSTVSVQPDCFTPTGTITISAPLGSQFEYSIDGNNYQAGTSFSGAAPNTYNVRVRNSLSGCISNPFAVTINVAPITPAIPTAAISAQPTCTNPSGTILVTAPTGASLVYSIDAANYQAGGSFSGLAPGAYNVRVRDNNGGCISGPLALVVNPVPLPPDAPQAKVTFQPTCTTPSGTIEITSPTGTGLEYSVDRITWKTGLIFTGLTPKTYTVGVRNTATACISEIALVVNDIPDLPVPPIAVVTQPTCVLSTGSMQITGPVGTNIRYSILPGIFQAGTLFSGVSPGAYEIRAQNMLTGCISNSTPVTIHTVSSPLAAPEARVTIQPDCSIATGTILITANTGNDSLLEYSVDGVDFQAGVTFAGLLPGNYAARVRNKTTGCISALTPLLINPALQSPPAPAVNTPVTHCQITNGIQPLTADGTNLKWYDVATGGNGSSIAPVPDASIVGSTIWYVSQTNAQGCESPRSVIRVNIVERPVITIPVKMLEIQFGQSVILPASIIGQGVTIRWTPATGLNNPAIERPLARPENTTTYTVLAAAAQACSASDTIRVIVLKEILIPNVFSPNGDGINDNWVIRHIEDYQQATLDIFDRYGKLIYRSNSGALPWDGTINGKQVPAGTYYYVIKLDSSKVLNGSVTVLR
jgi:gliding motility-associated-like protein